MSSFSCFCPCFGDRASAALPEEVARGGRGGARRVHRWRRPGRLLSRLIRRGRRDRSDPHQELVVQEAMISEIDHQSDSELSIQEEIRLQGDFFDVFSDEEVTSQLTTFTVKESEPLPALAGTDRTGTVKLRLVPIMLFCALILLFIFANIQRPVRVQGTNLVLGSTRPNMNNSLVLKSASLDEPCFERGQVVIDYSWFHARWCILALFCVGFMFVVYSIHDILFGAILIMLYVTHRFRHRHELRLVTWIRRFIS